MLLSGVRVIDFGRFIAGPYCAALLGDHGADVIRVERIEGGEDRRVPPVAPSGEGGTYLQMNRNKRCMTLDMGSAEAPAIVERLLASADVVVANLPPAVLAKWGLDHERLRVVHPRLVMTLVTAYGRGGPRSGQPGFDTLGQAMSGAMHLSGEPGRPVRTLANYNDIGTATACAMGTIAALWQRERTGQGQLVEGSLLHTALIHTDALLIEESVTGVGREPQGNRSFNAAPVDAFQTRDGWITIQVVGQRVWERCCRLIGRPQWADCSRFASDALRAEHALEIGEAVSRWCAALTRDEAMGALGDAHIPAAPVLAPRETLSDLHVQAMNWLEPADFPGLEDPYPLAAHPVAMSHAQPRFMRRAPTLGEHTDDVLRELGYGADDIARLRAQGVV